MKKRFALHSTRRKYFADFALIVFVASCLLGITLFSENIYAQIAGQQVASPKPAGLPRAFASFTASDVLDRIFDDYDADTGRVASIHNLEGKPALVEINKAALWKVQGQDRLVVLVDIESDDTFTGLCGNCFANNFLAVLEKKGTALSLMAKQLTLKANGAPVEYESLDEEQLIQYSGHGDISLDLAPYKINERETLIGVRVEYIWLPTFDWSTSLSLYQIENGGLKKVFNEPVIERRYADAEDENGVRAVEKTTSVISLSPANPPGIQKFNNLVVNKTLVRCTNKFIDEDCNAKRPGFRRLGTQTEMWRFDGRRYVRDASAK